LNLYINLNNENCADNQYYRYNRTDDAVESGHPRALADWRGLPQRVDAAMQWTNGRTYFFSGVNYYRFNDKPFEVQSSLINNIRNIM